MVKIVKGTLIVNHEDDKASEIDKFVIVLELKMQVCPGERDVSSADI